MRLLWLLATLVALTSAGILKDSPKERYDNFRVYKLTIRNKIQLAAIEKISELTKKVRFFRARNEKALLTLLAVA